MASASALQRFAQVSCKLTHKRMITSTVLNVSFRSARSIRCVEDAVAASKAQGIGWREASWPGGYSQLVWLGFTLQICAIRQGMFVFKSFNSYI